MKKVLYTASNLSHIKNFHMPYLKWFHENGFEVHIGAGMGEEPLEYADKRIPFCLHKKMSSAANWKAAWQLKQVIEQEQYDIVSCHTELGAFFTRIAVMLSKHRPTAVIYTSHGYLFDENTDFLKRTLMLCAEKFVRGVTDEIMVMNQSDKQIVLTNKLSNGSIAEINGMGIDMNRFSLTDPKEQTQKRKLLGIAPDLFVMLFAGELSKRKNQSMLIKAMDKLPKDTCLILAGNGELDRLYRQLISESSSKQRIFLCGHIDNIEDYIKASDICVSSSRYEGLPFHVMESLSCGKPAVVSNVKGNRDLVKNGQNGYAFSFNDTDDFVQKVLQLRNELAQGSITAENCRNSVKKYAKAIAFKQITSEYEKFI